MLTPPPEFVAARNALAKRLRGDGRRDDASAIAAIRRPSWTDWALNRAAVADPDLAARFADAADRMRAAQRSAIAGGDADVAGALRSLRDAMAAIAKAAGTELRSAGRTADAAGLTERLTDVAGDGRLTAAVRSAVLIDEGEEVLGGVLDVEQPADVVIAPKTDSPRKAARRARDASQESSSDEPSAAVERAARRRRLEREADELREQTAATERDLRRTERAAGEAAHARKLAAAAVERAQADLAAADQRLSEVTDRRASLQRELDEAAAALARIEGEIRDIESSRESPQRATRRRGRRA